VLVTMRNAKTALDCGYTSVLSAASAKPRLGHRHPQRDQRRPHSPARAISPTGRS
jgi:hypothetical protein